MPVWQRMQIAIAEAGPSITITSLTNAIAFVVGAQSSILALKSFCSFASIAVLMLYWNALSVFAAVVAFDLKRQAKHWPDCCFLCCCSEKSIFCCKGLLLAPRQRRFSDLKGDNVWLPPKAHSVVKENASSSIWPCCCCCLGPGPPKGHFDDSSDTDDDPKEVQLPGQKILEESDEDEQQCCCIGNGAPADYWDVSSNSDGEEKEVTCFDFAPPPGFWDPSSASDSEKDKDKDMEAT